MNNLNISSVSYLSTISFLKGFLCKIGKFAFRSGTLFKSNNFDSVEHIKNIHENIERLSNNSDEHIKELIRHQISTKWSIIDHLERTTTENNLIESCPLCGHTGQFESFSTFESHCIFGGGRLVRLQCPSCDTIYGPKKMLALNAAELSQEYESHYRVYQEGDSNRQEMAAFHSLNPTTEGIYLNFGAGGWSNSVRLLREQGWNVYAFEPHESAICNPAYLIRSKRELLSSQFDGIFSNNVLEHLRHPIEELKFMASLLKPGCRMAHATPCFEYRYEFTRFHLFFYLGRSRNLLAREANLRFCDFITDGEFMCALYEA